MNKFLIPVSAILASLALTACTTTGSMPPADHVSNGEYFIYKYPGNLPHVEDSQPAEYGLAEFDQLVHLDRDCRVQMAPQTPSALKSIGTTTVRTAVPIAILGGLGTAQGIKAVTTATKGYRSYGTWSAGGSGAGAGLGGGIDRHLTGNRYAQAGCMNAAITEAKRMDGALKGIDVVFNADSVNGNSLRRPAGTVSAEPAKRNPDPDAEAANVTPHP